MRSLFQHLRFPFSLFLLPVFLFSLSHSQSDNFSIFFWAFVILHIFIYPASNAYNSYFDKDTGPIGGIANPLPTTKLLYYTSLVFDAIGILLAFIFCNANFAIALFIYGLLSKAYSHPSIRLKKYPIISWVVVGFFQGAFIFLALYQLFTQNPSLNFSTTTLLAAVLSSVNLMAFYPITQVYQHEADREHGDTTMSIKLGIKGTFVFAAVLFALATFGFYVYFNNSKSFIQYLVCMAPALLFFNFWVVKVWKNEAEANFKNTMIMNILGSACLNIFFLLEIYKDK